MFSVNFNKIIRASYYAFIIGGALTLLYGTSNPITLVFILAGWTGMYLRQSKHAGLLGQAGYVLFVLSILVPPFLPVNVDALASGAPDYGLIAFTVLQITSYVLFGFATMRARVFPRDAGLILLLGGILFPIFAQYGTSLAYILLGFTLLLNRSLFRPTLEAEGEELVKDPKPAGPEENEPGETAQEEKPES